MMNYDWIWDAGKVTRWCCHCHGRCYILLLCFLFFGISWLHVCPDVCWYLLMLFTIPTCDVWICTMCTLLTMFFQDCTCKSSLDKNWLQYTCQVYQPSMHAQRLFWNFSSIGDPNSIGYQASAVAQDLVKVSLTWQSSGCNQTGETWKKLMDKLTFMWFNIFWGTFKFGKGWSHNSWNI